MILSFRSAGLLILKMASTSNTYDDDPIYKKPLNRLKMLSLIAKVLQIREYDLGIAAAIICGHIDLVYNQSYHNGLVRSDNNRSEAHRS